MESFSSFAGAVMIFFMCTTVGVSIGAMFNPRLRAIGDSRGALPYLAAVFAIGLAVAVACALGLQALIFAGPPAWLMWWHLMAASLVVAAILAALLPRPSKSAPPTK